jgi:uncharacterized protein
MTEMTLPPVIQAMLQPSFYPHAVQGEIQLIQTHVSYVFLTGDFVYKVKKPVNFGFLDFSTLEKRQHFCHEELRLNQRAAAALYLEVVSIGQSGESFQLESCQPSSGEPVEAEIVEYAVKMQQFPQASLLSAIFDRGELTAQHMTDLAQEVAAFHAKADINDHIRSYGTVAKVRQAFDENYEQTTNAIGGPQTQAQFDATKAYTDRIFTDQAAVLTDRVSADKIRECHGDLHLGNIALWNAKIWLFDCIEFNEPFRFVDTMYDVAFTCMDLDARQRPDLSNVFLNAYLEQTGDYEGLQILSLYRSRQAYVRAKVNTFMLNDPGVPDAVKHGFYQTATNYYRLAWEYTQPRTGRLVMMAGLSGSGKSTLAKTIATQHHAILLRSDAIRKHLAGIPVSELGSDAIYTPEMTQKTYDRLRELGILLVQQGYTVILDAKYDRQALRQAVIAEATGHGIDLTILHCDAPIAVLESRVASRTGDIADATVSVLAQQSLEAFADTEQGWVKSIDTTQSIDAQLAQAGL